MSWLDDLVAWVDGAVDTPVASAPQAGANWLPDEPDAVVVVSAAGGTPPLFDGAFEPVLVHVRCRDSSDAAAETLSLQVHELVAGSAGSFTMSSTRVLWAEATKGKPVLLDRDVKERSIYVGEYEFCVPT